MGCQVGGERRIEVIVPMQGKKIGAGVRVDVNDFFFLFSFMSLSR